MKVATEDRVGRDELDEFVRRRRRLLLVNTRDDGRPQVSPVVGALDDDWDEYRQAMRDRGKVAIDVAITDWGPIATGGVPPELTDAD